jgi:transglutaminase-like putative cysteine protease
MPKFSIHHITRYSYEAPVYDSANQVILYPVDDAYQEVLKHELKVTGNPLVDIYTDYYGNQVGSFMYTPAHTELVIDSKIEVLTHPRTLPDGIESLEQQWQHIEACSTTMPFIDFLQQEHFAAIHEVAQLADAGACRQVSVFEAAQKVTDYVYQHFTYIKGITTVETTLDEIWQLKAGVCQDFAHILLVMLRMLRIPARYVSGYICPHHNGMRGEGATHAWVEAYIPFYGWLGFDPTNNCIAGQDHIRLAVGRNFSDCSPVKGNYKGAARHRLEVGVSVVYEDGITNDDTATILTPQAVSNMSPNDASNSWRRHMEMMQQQ